MDISMESFHAGGAKTGAILRRQEGQRLRCLVVHHDAEGLHRTDLALDHDGDVRGWSACTCTTQDGTVTVRRTSDTTIDVDGHAVDAPPDTVPSLAAPVVLAQMLAGSHTEEELHTLDEAAPTAPPREGHFSVGNPETVSVPGRGEIELGSVTLYRDDRPTDRFWFDSDEVVVSDWQGPRSYHVATLDELTEGLHPEVVTAVREFLA